MNHSLPIWQTQAAILDVLTTGNRLVLVAPTGSGKTTQVPQMLLDAGLAGEKKIVVLQPRRVAARTVAARVAWERNTRLGAEVGYQIRFEDHTSVGTRICFLTEGILLRWLQDDRTLADVGIILFDEFHERNLLSDVALALVKRLQQTTRADLKVVVMSATLDAEPVADYLGQSTALTGRAGAAQPEGCGYRSGACPILVSEGQSFPVAVRYLEHADRRPVTEQAADAVESIVTSEGPGDVLVFMPGMGEINSTINALRAARMGERVELIPLHGDLPPEDQDRAFASSAARKIIVATNVAETSITIDGIRHVVDSGQARVARYDAERGIGTLFIEDISRASADQRKGRAGRTAPGTCYRLWTESGQLNRPERNTPEIQRSDLAEVVLLLHSLGIKRATEFDWLDRPEPQSVERAERLLETLGALRTREREPSPAVESVGNEGAARRPGVFHDSVPPTADLTPVGWQMLRLPMHPRYSRMLVEAARRDCVPAAALCAALVSGRDLLMRSGRDDKGISEARESFEANQDSDFFTLMRAFQFAQQNNFSLDPCRRYGVHAQTARQVAQTYQQLMDIAGKQGWGRGSNAGIHPDNPASANRGSQSDEALLRCLTAGFIDQLCLRRNQGTLECDLTEGRQGTLMRESVVQNSTLLVAATIREVTGRGSENLTLLGLATAVKREWIEEMFPDQVTIQVEHLYDRTHKRVAAVKLVRFRDLVIHHEHQRDVDPAAAGRCLAAAHRSGFFELPLFNHEVKQFIARVNLVCATMPELEFPPLDDSAIDTCLGRAFRGLTLAKDAQGMQVRAEFWRHLAPEQLGWLDELTPLSLPWSDGRKMKLLYAPNARDDDGEPNPPELQIKLHECFALKEHPAICEGKLPVKLWLCAPDGKRLESTFNWPAFKANTYPKLRSQLQKKHPGIGWL